MSAADAVPQVYVACLAAYNNGQLHGRWVDATLGEHHISDAIEAMLANSPQPDAEEWVIHDYSGFGGANLGENPDLDEVATLAELIKEYGDLAVELYKHKCHVDEARKAFDEQYQGEFRSVAEWAEQFLDDTGGLSQVPEDLRYYFDYAKWARDAEMSGDIVELEVNGASHVFWNH